MTEEKKGGGNEFIMLEIMATNVVDSQPPTCQQTGTPSAFAKINNSAEKLGEEEKMPQSGVGSMQGKETGNMPSAVCASSMNKSLDPTPI